MRASHKMIVSMLFVGGALALSPIVSAAPYLSVDFQSDTAQSGSSAGTPGGTSYYTAPAGSKAYVVDSNSTPPNPSTFGTSGNQSLMLEQDTTSPYVAYSGNSTGLTKGTASVQFYLVQDGTFADMRADFRFGTGNVAGTSSIGPWMGVYGNKVRVFTPPIGGTQWLDNTVTPNAVHTLVINFDVSTHKYSGTLDGQTLKYEDTSHNTITSFDFISNLSKLTTVGVGLAYPAQTFYDNLTMAVPEPASMGLLGMGAAGLLMGRRRR